MNTPNDDAAWWSAVQSGNPEHVYNLLSRRGATCPIAGMPHIDPNDIPVVRTLPGLKLTHPNHKSNNRKKHDELLRLNHSTTTAPSSKTTYERKMPMSMSAYFWLPDGVNTIKIRTHENAAHVAAKLGHYDVLNVLILERINLVRRCAVESEVNTIISEHLMPLFCCCCCCSQLGCLFSSIFSLPLPHSLFNLPSSISLLQPLFTRQKRMHVDQHHYILVRNIVPIVSDLIISFWTVPLTQ